MVVAAALLYVCAGSAQAQGVSYLYDDLGRLKRVVDEHGNVATYNYDAVGNILSIERGEGDCPAGLPTISQITIDSCDGGTGCTVTIDGTSLLGAAVGTGTGQPSLSDCRGDCTRLTCILNSTVPRPVDFHVTTALGSVQTTQTPPIRSVTITTPTTIGATDHSYDGSALTVDGAPVVIDGSHEFFDLTLVNGAVVTHSSTSPTASSRLDVEVIGTLTIDGTSAIDVTGRGYGPDRRLGNLLAVSPHDGGSYGGLGGDGNVLGNVAGVYGDYRDPNELGSGGGQGCGHTPGSGGGLVRLTAGMLQLNGTIRADGTTSPNVPPSSSCGGGGAGGGLRVAVGTLTGTGLMAANGAVGGVQGGGGGGGRIAIYYDDASGYDLSGGVQARGGAGVSIRPGGAGTIYVKDNAQALGELRIADAAGTGVTPIGGTVPDRVVLQGGAQGEIVSGTVAELTITGVGTTLFAEDLTVGALQLTSGGLLTHRAATTTATYDLAVSATTVTIDATSAIDVTGRGYGPDRRLGNVAGVSPHDGGSYGGLGGDGNILGNVAGVYGDYRDPNELGSGGGSGCSHTPGTGGGLVRLTAGTLQLNGTIRADGTTSPNVPPSSSCGGGGAGGGLRVAVGTLTGTGLMAANGAVGGVQGGGGGGGRIAIYYDDASGYDLSGAVQARGGAGVSIRPGGAGTIYLKDNAQALGELRIADAVGTGVTPIGGTVPDRVVLQGGAQGEIVSGTVADLTITGVGTTLFAEDLTVGALQLTSGGLLTHRTATTTATYDLALSATTVTIDATSAIDVTGRGYGPDRRLGNLVGVSPHDGGSYGGLGGDGNVLGNVAGVYGDYRDPNELGSGGGQGCSHTPGTGGGLVRLTAGTLQLNGTIRADGTTSPNVPPSSSCGGGGAGGGLRLAVGTLTGTGVMAANGAVGGVQGGGGGGGRIAIYYDDASGYDLSGGVQARGGAGVSIRPGGAGTIYVKDNAQALGELRIADVGGTGVTPIGGTITDRVVLQGGAQGEIVSGTVAELTITGTGTTLFAEDLTVGALQLTSGGLLTHRAATTTATYDLAVSATTLTIDSTSAIDVTGRGYGPDRRLGNVVGVSPHDGGSYGGLGGDGNVLGNVAGVYGDYRDPNELGSGGGQGCGHTPGTGGGLVRLTAGTLQLNGTIRADGTTSPNVPPSSSCGGGGAGGGLRLAVGTLTGTGLMAANGAVGGVQGGGGGGGRIAIYYDDASGYDLSSVQARGGAGVSIRPGGAGTIYLQSGAQSPGIGDLRVDNGGVVGAAGSTPLRAVGPRISTGLNANSLLVASASFAVPNATTGAIGLIGVELNPDTTQSQTFTIVNNTATELFTDPSDGDMTLVAVSGDAAIGVYTFDDLIVRNGASLVTPDACVVLGTVDSAGGHLSCGTGP